LIFAKQNSACLLFVVTFTFALKQITTHSLPCVGKAYKSNVIVFLAPYVILRGGQTMQMNVNVALAKWFCQAITYAFVIVLEHGSENELLFF
jgi:hypothetical protein